MHGVGGVWLKADVRRCLARAMYLSAPEVALSTWGAITNVELCLFCMRKYVVRGTACVSQLSRKLRERAGCLLLGAYGKVARQNRMVTSLL